MGTPLIGKARNKENSSLNSLLGILCCPVCRGGVRKSGKIILCTKCRRIYRIKEKTPYMLADK